MKELKYVPKPCQEGGEFEGHVMVRVPLFDERYEMLDQMGLKVEASGEVNAKDISAFASLRKMVAASLKFYQSVDIKHKDGREFKSVEDLQSDPDCDAILMDVSSAVTRGFKPGKN